MIAKTRHGLYDLWYNMLQRCYNPKYKGYKNYGARGIVVCPRWHVFNNFVADIEASIGLHRGLKTLDRIDNDGNYEPGNVRWATMTEQTNNRRVLTKLTKEQVAEIRAKYASGAYSQRDLAKLYRVSQPWIWRVIKNEVHK